MDGQYASMHWIHIGLSEWILKSESRGTARSWCDQALRTRTAEGKPRQQTCCELKILNICDLLH